ncbi:VOC family protein [Sporosarcina sp. ANT_H38]|uniref:VOC family protein n=1 Tax=Sporosarcina sp. ANT_H38 TaxID=2597358 RepID=UPI0011F2C933|nr:VOC family protein [Sporosarcina sp. ANT_H38]KAA0965710.1 VOC family protein [Sporosarcina sp. ANT_H38]
MGNQWPAEMQVAQVRVARPTDQLREVEEFYCEGIGLRKVGSFEGHEGYDGLMIGLPNTTYHLEFTQHIDGSPCPVPTKDNLLVLYIPDSRTIEEIANRLKSMGYDSVPPENPYWAKLGITIEDPDGWRIVLMNTPGIA